MKKEINKKFPEDFINKILHGDCFDLLPLIPDESIDLIITDPPYNLGYAFENDNLSTDKMNNFIYNYCKEFKRIIKINGTICIFSSQELSHYLYFNLINLNLIWQNEIIWNKDSGHASLNKLKICHERIIIFTKGNNHKTFNINKIRVKSKYSETDKRLNPKGKNPGDVWYIPALLGKKEERIINIKTNLALHPTQKPIEIIDKLLKAYSNKGDIVLDCFSGLSTTAISSIDNNCNFICIEKDEEYFEASIKRLKQSQWKTNEKGNKKFRYV